jgi:hypothetical protein
VQSKGFLGGKYVEPVQVIAGEVQTFTARQSGTGRPVYVHQITGTAQGEQTKLLKLLLMCLYRIPAVKERVLDISDEGDVYYVVTESSPPYLLLKDWLEREWEKAEANSGQSRPEARPAGDKRSEQPFREEALREGVQRPTPPKQSFDQGPPAASGIPRAAPPVAKASDDQGEFTRLFQQANFHRPPAAAPSEDVQRPPSAPPKPAPQPEVPRKSGLPNTPDNSPAHRDPFGETQLFSPASQNPKQTEQHSIQSSPMRPVTPVPPSPAPARSLDKSLPGPRPGIDDRGEHTRLFTAPAPTGPPKQNAAGPTPADSVVAGKPQIPNNTEPPRSVPGEFTKLFNAGPGVQPPEKSPLSPDPKPLAGQGHEPGEFTRFFSSDPSELNRSSPPLSTPAVQRPSAPPPTPPRSSATPPQGAPGEFTQLFSGAPQGEGRSAPAAPLNFKNASVPGDPFRNPQPQGRSGTAGEFTRMFGVVSDTPQPSGWGGSAGPGEYTKLFGIPGSAPVTPQSQKAPGAPSSLPSLNEPGPGAASPGVGKGTGPGEFTQVIGQPSSGPAAGGATREPPNAAMAGGGSPAMPLSFKPQVPPVPQLNMPHVSASGPSVTPPSVAGGAAQPPAMTAPHVQGQVAGVGVSASPHMPASPPIPQSAMPLSASSKPRTALIVVFAVLLVLAIALVVLIATQR